MNNFGVSPQAMQEAQTLLTSLGTGGKSGPTFEETMAQDQQKAQAEAERDGNKIVAEQERERMKLGAKMQEAVMKNEMAMQQSRESNALDFQKHKMTTQMQAAQPQQAQPNQTAQTAVNNQYHNNDAASQVPRYLGNNFA